VAAEESAREIEARATAAAQACTDDAQRTARETVDRANRQAARTIAEAERRRDAIADEIAGLRRERDRFVEALRASMTSIGGVVGGLSEEEAAAAVRAATAPVEAADDASSDPAPPTADDAEDHDEAEEVVVAPEPDVPAPAPAPEPVVLDADADDAPADHRDADDGDADAAPDTSAAEPEVVLIVDDAAPAAADEPATTDVAGEQDDSAGAAAAPADAPAEPSVESRRDACLEDLRTAMARQCKRGLQEVQNEVLASIRDHGRGAGLDDLLPSEADLDELGAQGTDHLAAAYDGALVDAAAEVDGPAPDAPSEARVQAAVATFRAVLAHEVTSALRATLRAGLEAEEPEPQLSERVGEVFRDLRGPVIEAAVDAHLQRTYGHGLLDAWEQLGVTRVRWEAHVEPRCPEGRCRTNAAEGPVEIGADFPSGDRVPPAHPGCSCVVVPADVAG
jgi:hypothetical protein